LRPAEELVPLVRTQARKTVELSGAVGHVLLGVLAAAFDYDWKEAELHFGLFLASGESKEEARATCANYLFSIRPYPRSGGDAGEDGRIRSAERTVAFGVGQPFDDRRGVRSGSP
jgi:hypothetical protein